jgi:hypothetical protein
MAKDQKVEGKTEAKKITTIASVYQIEGMKGAKDRKELATRIITTLAKSGQTKNVKGKDIKIERVLQQISAMTRDINNNRGNKTGGWWSKYKVTEDDTQYKLLPR